MSSRSGPAATSDSPSTAGASGALPLPARNSCVAREAAHEFSNLMTVILGYTQILELELESQPAALARLREIGAAASRAAILIEAMREHAE